MCLGRPHGGFVGRVRELCIDCSTRHPSRIGRCFGTEKPLASGIHQRAHRNLSFSGCSCTWTTRWGMCSARSEGLAEHQRTATLSTGGEPLSFRPRVVAVRWDGQHGRRGEDETSQPLGGGDGQPLRDATAVGEAQHVDPPSSVRSSGPGACATNSSTRGSRQTVTTFSTITTRVSQLRHGGRMALVTGP
jgi:hypothetical protein